MPMTKISKSSNPYMRKAKPKSKHSRKRRKIRWNKLKASIYKILCGRTPLFCQNQGELLGCQQMATCWAKQLSPHVYLKVIDIGKQNQGFLKISNFHTTWHSHITSLYSKVLNLKCCHNQMNYPNYYSETS